MQCVNTYYINKHLDEQDAQDEAQRLNDYHIEQALEHLKSGQDYIYENQSGDEVVMYYSDVSNDVWGDMLQDEVAAFHYQLISGDSDAIAELKRLTDSKIDEFVKIEFPG